MTLSRRTLLSHTALMFASSVLWPSAAQAQTTTSPAASDAAQSGPPGSGVFSTDHIKAATAVTEVFGEGQKITAAIGAAGEKQCWCAGGLDVGGPGGSCRRAGVAWADVSGREVCVTG